MAPTWFLRIRRLSADPRAQFGLAQELRYHIEGGKTKVCVELGNVFRKGCFGSLVFEGAFRVENKPERHFG